MSWFRKSGSGEDTADLAKPVLLNAGGVLYTVSRGALRHLATHPIFGPIYNGTAARSAEDAAYYVDCDGTLFRHILNYFRSGGGATPAERDANETELSTSSLCLPDSFDEWEQLRAEARRMELPMLEAAIVAQYEYQRRLFLRTLPLGVCVRWPTTVIVREGNQQQLPQHAGVSAPAVASPTLFPASPVMGPSTGSGGVALANKVANGALRVTVAPPLPALSVAEDGRTVLYGAEAEVIPDLERLVQLLVSQYGYRIEHWQEREGRVFFSRQENNN